MPDRIRLGPMAPLGIALPLVALMLTPALLLAQPTAEGELSPAFFIPLTGKGCAVRYTSGSLDRAHHLLMRLELLTGHFNEWSDVPTPTVIYLLNREEWGRAKLPDLYGLPLRLAPSSVAMPSTGDAEAVWLWRSKLAVARLPLIPGVPLRGTAEEAAAMAIADLLFQVEAARGFAQRAGLFAREPWVAELAAHVAARVLFERYESERLAEIDHTYGRLAATLGGAAAYPLAGFQPGLLALGADQVDRWLWYQAQFHDGARMVLEKTGKKTMKRWLALSNGGGRLNESELLGFYPEIVSWLDARFARPDR